MTIQAILFDLDGVFYQGKTPIAGANNVAAWVTKRKIPHLFLTNTTSKSRSALVKKLLDMGIKTDEHHILTPAIAAAHYLKTKTISNNLALFVPEDTRQDFSGFQFLDNNAETGADAVIIGDMGPDWDFKLLNKAFRLLIARPKPLFIALGMTRYWLAEDGFRLDVAPFVVALQFASEVVPTVTGKPAQMYYQTALDLLDVSADQAIMIGDDIIGDIQGAQQVGLHAILLKTGKFQASDLEKNIKPDAVFDSVNDLPNWWDTQRQL